MIVKINPKAIPFKTEIQAFCTYSYPDHPKGCPNYGKKECCPPNQQLIDKVLDYSREAYVIYTEFNIEEHATRMKEKHPNWTEKQIYSSQYWQSKATKMHKEEEERAKQEYGLTKILSCPEANGVNVDALMKKIKAKLEWPPRNLVRLVSIGGF
ncbi:hypothetical protein HZA33_00980 [Candidatus Pacearchaeota archaeon]|nr:hypothetical protein [Candidatus Pacearchaeota archaeon]